MQSSQELIDLVTSRTVHEALARQGRRIDFEKVFGAYGAKEAVVASSENVTSTVAPLAQADGDPGDEHVEVSQPPYEDENGKTWFHNPVSDEWDIPASDTPETDESEQVYSVHPLDILTILDELDPELDITCREDDLVEIPSGGELYYQTLEVPPLLDGSYQRAEEMGLEIIATTPFIRRQS